MRAGVVLLLLMTSACATPAAEPAGGPPDEPPYIEGAVTDVTASPEGGRVMVEEAEGGNKAAVTVTAETVVVQEFGGGYEPSDLSQLRPGLAVAVWTTQPVRQSFPVQIIASGIVIRER